MPIPGPPLPDYGVPAVPTGSPFWLRVNGVWLQVEGVVPTVQTSTERPSSAMTSLNGNRYEQKARLARRAWSWTMPHAAAAHIAAIRAAVDSSSEIQLMSDAVAVSNMLPPRSCFGATAPVIDCGGVPLLGFTAPAVVTGRVRGGVPTTLSCWTDRTVGAPALNATFPGGSAAVVSAGGGQVADTFVPTADGTITITVQSNTSGLMLTEGDPSPTFVAGESMPCPVTVDDPDDVLTMHHRGAWRHTYTVNLREVG
ncbi:MAG TPA: hypothetical protein VNS46_20765 [Nocardioides sp.]|nr:hypothetical protein [Nocardioides sp.]